MQIVVCNNCQINLKYQHSFNAHLDICWFCHSPCIFFSLLFHYMIYLSISFSKKFWSIQFKRCIHRNLKLKTWILHLLYECFKKNASNNSCSTSAFFEMHSCLFVALCSTLSSLLHEWSNMERNMCTIYLYIYIRTSFMQPVGHVVWSFKMKTKWKIWNPTF